ncbi:MAG TPA: hypothetical protein VGV35_03615, partial [Bryobacteraceae bacterium]|nr:hypothetical protein [Bryobacteraceae bacterium]
MNEDYLWDKSGEADPEVQRLENLLAPLGHKPGRMPAWPAARRNWVPIAVGIAAAVLITFGAVWMMHLRTRPAWQVATVDGTSTTKRLAGGQSLTTDAHSRLRLDRGDVGEVVVEPNTRLSVVAIKPEEQRLALDRGTIRATIWAPPGRFFVNTPSSQTVDLGCQYTLHVDADGAGLVQVSVGWVAFEDAGRESFIPATAACVTRPGKGPGIPYYEDASAALIDAVRRFDVNADGADATVILNEARARDAISLWHLLRRVAAGDRGQVYDRMAQLIAVPASVTRDGIVAGDSKMIDALWDTLDLGNTSWWRMWKSRG